MKMGSLVPRWFYDRYCDECALNRICQKRLNIHCQRTINDHHFAVTAVAERLTQGVKP